MGHPNRKQVRIPARLLDDLCLALGQAAGIVEGKPADEVERGQVAGFARRTLSEARRRAAADKRSAQESDQQASGNV